MTLAFLDTLFYGLFWTVVMMGLSYAINELTKKTPKAPLMEPDALSLPSTREGTKYVIFWGDVWITAPVVAWWGDVMTTGIRRHYTVNNWFNNKRKYYYIGFRYFMGVHFILCQGSCDGPKQIKVGDILAWPEVGDPDIVAADGVTEIEFPYSIYESTYWLFGGEEQEGGISGTIDFLYGEMSQTPNDYLESQQGDNISAHRGLFSAVMRQVYIGTSPYPKPWWFRLRRVNKLTDGTAQWYSGKAEVGGGLNAAHILHEIYTNALWGYGHAESLLPNSVWQTVADVLYDEGFGLSLKWEDPNQTLQQVEQEVLRHIDAKLYEDPETGYFILKLIRDDYEQDDLETFDENDIQELSDFGRATIHEAVNSVLLRYWDIKSNKPVAVTDHDMGLWDMQGGGIIPLEVDYLAVTDPALAMKLVAREKQQMGAFQAVARIKAKRTMAHLRPGDVFKLNWAPLNIMGMVMRVLEPDYGTLVDGVVGFNLVEDLFSTATAYYDEPPDTDWENPRSEEPIDVNEILLQELPFWDIVQNQGLSSAIGIGASTGFLQICTARPWWFVGPVRTRPNSYDYQVLLRNSPAGEFYLDGIGDYTPAGMLIEPMPCNAVDIEITITWDSLGTAEATQLLSFDYNIHNPYAMIGDEIMKILSCDLEEDVDLGRVYKVTLARGCLDTVPAYHTSEDSGGGDYLWFSTVNSYVSGQEYSDADQPGVKILPRTVLGILAAADATAHNAPIFDSRAYRPYPPGNFKINGVSYPSSFSGEPTLTWSHRDRTQQIDEITEHDEGDIGPEAGTTYTIQIYDENNTLVHTETGITGTSWTYTWEEEMADCGLDSADPLNTQLRFKLWSVRNSYASWQAYDLVVPRA